MLQQFVSPVFWQSVFLAMLGRMHEGGGMIMILLLCTLVFAAAVTFVRTRGAQWSWADLRHHVLPPGTLKHPSARADVLFWLSKRLVMPPLILVLGLSTAAAGTATYTLLGYLVRHPHHTAPASAMSLLLFTFTMLVVYDFANYSFHMLQHRIPLLWEFHKVHHSAQLLVGVTKDRVHPVDEIVSRWWGGLISGPVYAVWLYFLLDPIELTIFGMDAYALTNTVIMMDFVRHTHMKLTYGRWLDAIFLSPHYHQLHHSIDPSDYDRNFGQVLSVWDRLFGTLKAPGANQDFAFGLMHSEHDEYQSLRGLYWVPIRKAVRVLREGHAFRFATKAPLPAIPAAILGAETANGD
jgi:sterol desaturase/sphingolipid hydroxylase (fatty acid hydroxylase superfamily)